MKYSIIASTAEEARAEAAKKHRGDLHISCVFFVRGRPDVREFVFTTVLLP